MATRKKTTRSVSVYSNLANKRREKKDEKSRRKAEYLSTLPKHPLKRLLYRMEPRRLAKFWFSREGAILALKGIGIAVLVMLLLVGALIAYYRKDIDQIRPGSLAQRVKTTVTRYYDRNDQLLWEDKGDGDYTLTVDGDKIAPCMAQATVAIEDKDFYKHSGVSPSGIIRASLSNAQGNSIQGGSTLTQQLVKQVFFSREEANQRGIAGIPRKIKEMILAIEVENMYTKKQIIDLYLNESPYGGRRNGVESAAQAYFGKSSKDLTLPECSLLAAIPNNPSIYNPYRVEGHKALLERQRKVLDDMVSMGYIKKDEADAAKKVAVLDTVRPVADHLANIKAPHFVLMVREQLEKSLGKSVVGNGGLIVKTTLDSEIQQKLEDEMNVMFSSYYPGYAGFSNGAAVIEDVPTGQIVALLGSRSYEYPGFGQDNAATAFIQPGSSIKPLVYAKLFENQGEGKQNYGAGSILSDTTTNFNGYKPQNADGGFRGNISLRQSLALSRNIPAIKAMAVAGKDETWKTIRDLGDTYYCTQGPDADAGLSSAIGGCGTRMVDHVNAIASLARMGTYMPSSSILEVKSSTGETLKKYTASTKQVLDPQAAYVVNDILADQRARSGLFGASITPNLDAAGFKFSLKTGTSDKDKKPKDIWTVGYTPQLAGTVWLGNPDTSVLTNGNSSIPARVLDPVMAFALTTYKNRGVAMDWFKQPEGIQRINGDIYPSYFSKNNMNTTTKVIFDRVSKKKATDCTPAGAKIEISVMKSTDPITKKDIYVASDGYDPLHDDDAHSCSDAKPSVTFGAQSGGKVSVSVTSGKFPLQTLEVKQGDTLLASQNVSSSTTVSVDLTQASSGTISATLVDSGYYTANADTNYTAKRR